MSNFLNDYAKHVEERAALMVVPQPLNAKQTSDLIELMCEDNPPQADFLMDLFENRIPAGVDEAAYVKATFLKSILDGKKCSLISREKAIEILGLCKVVIILIH